MKKKLSALCLVLFALLITFQELHFPPAQTPTSTAISKPISVTVELADITFEEADGYDFVQIPGCGGTSEIGAPLLPVRTVLVVLPPRMEVAGINVDATSSIKLSDKYIYPAQPPAVQGKPHEPAGPDPKIYGSNEPYPGKLFQATGVYRFRGYRIASIRIFPVQYAPAVRELTFYKTFVIDVDVASSKEASSDFDRNAAALRKPMVEVDEWIKLKVANPEMLDEYKKEVPTPASFITGVTSREKGGASPQEPQGIQTYNYLIVTREMFQASVAPLVAGRTGAVVVTVDWIVNRYGGRDVPERIRNCTLDYYNRFGISFVLLAGDVDPADQVLNTPWEVPVRYVHMADGQDTSMPTDYYYAGLDGDWDADGDSIFGESVDYSTAEEADWYPEVFVGRITAQTTDQMDRQIEKTIAFNGFNLHHMLLCGAKSDPDTDEKILKEYIRDNFVLPYSPTTSTVELYESQGTLTEANVISAINTYQPEVANSAGHGGYTGLWPGPFFHTGTPASLTNTPYLWYAMACLAGGFDQSGDCVAEAMMKDPDGSAVATVMAMRVTWYAVGYPSHLNWLNGMQDWLFWKSFFEYGYQSPGVTLYMSKVDYIGYGFNLNDQGERKNLFAYMLLGDPLLVLKEPPEKLIIEDIAPWPGSGAEAANEAALLEQGDTYSIIRSAMVTATDLSQYKVVIIASDQVQAFYDRMSTYPVTAKLTDYVVCGGILVAHMTDDGWNGGTWTTSFLPGAPALSHVVIYPDDLTIVDSTHPVASGPYGTLTDAEIDGWGFSSHGYFTGLPAGAKIVIGVAGDPTGEPTYVEWDYGHGKVLATMQTVEWGYSVKGKPILLRNEFYYAQHPQIPSKLLFPEIGDDTTRGWRTSVMIQNPSSLTAKVAIQCYDDAGNLLNTYLTSIPAHGCVGQYARVFNSGNMFFGSIIVLSDVYLVGVACIVNNANTMSAEYSAVSRPSGELCFAEVSDDTSRGWRTVVVLQNPTSSTAHLDIYCYDYSGGLLNKYSTSIPPYGRLANYARVFNNGKFFFGTIVVGSDIELAGVGQVVNNANTAANAYEVP